MPTKNGRSPNDTSRFDVVQHFLSNILHTKLSFIKLNVIRSKSYAVPGGGRLKIFTIKLECCLHMEKMYQL